MNRRNKIKGKVPQPLLGDTPDHTPESNEVLPGESTLASSQTTSSHGQPAFIMDGHIHVMSRQLLQGLDIGQRYPDGLVDLPRIKEGQINAMFFSVFTPEPYYPGHFEVKNTFRVVELALSQIEKNNAVIEIALNASEIEEINSRGKMAAFLDLEGSFDMEGDLHILRALYRLGLRSLQLTSHNETNSFIDACYDKRLWNGINKKGREIIQEMNKLGMVINVAHASSEAIIQTAATSSHPIAYTHGGFRGIIDVKRNISDEAAKAVAAKGGVIGLQLGSYFSCPKYYKWETSLPPSKKPARLLEKQFLTIEDADREVAKRLPYVSEKVIPDEYMMSVHQLAKAIDYGIQLVGEDHVAFGSDFDGGIALPREMKDASDYPELYKALGALGYSQSRIDKVMGLNWLRLIRTVTE